MTDDQKRELRKQQGARLRSARIAAEFTTAAEVAKALKGLVSSDTYTQHENGWRGYKAHADKYAKLFGVTPQWLLWGDQANAKFSQIERIYMSLKGVDQELAADLMLGTLDRLAKGQTKKE